MVNVKTPTQLEDAAIADTIRSVVALKVRKYQRELQNEILESVVPQLENGRLKGKRVNLDRLIKEVADEVAVR